MMMIVKSYRSMFYSSDGTFDNQMAFWRILQDTRDDILHQPIANRPDT